MSSSDDTKEERKAGRFFLIFREVCALLLWSFVFVKTIIFDIDIYFLETYAPSLRWVLNYRFFGLLIFVSIGLLMLSRKKARNFLGYIVFYPGIVIFCKVPKLFFSNWAIAIAFAPALYELFSSFRFIFVIITMASVSCLFIVLSSNQYLIIPSMIFLGFFLVVHLYRNLRRAYRSSIFVGLSELVKKLRLKIKGSDLGGILWKKVAVIPDSEQSTKDYEQQLSTFYLMNWGVEFVTDKVYTVVKSRKLDLYLMLSWLKTIFVVSLIFAFEYWALYKMNAGSFSADYKLTFWNFWGFSFGKFTPSSVSAVRSISVIATMLTYSELFCSLIVLVILAFSILTAARERYKEDVDSFMMEMRGLGGDMQSQFFLLYDMALSDVEKILLLHNAVMVNWLRKSRGLPELKPPDKDVQKTE